MGLLSSVVGAVVGGATGGSASGPIIVERVKVIDGIKQLESIGSISDVHIQSFPCPKVNDRSVTGAWTLAKLASASITAAATAESFRAANEQYKISQRYWKLAKEEWDFFYDNYRPLEIKELSELNASLPNTPDYTNTVDGHTRYIDPIFSQTDKKRAALAAKFCICNTASDAIRFAGAKSTIHGDADNFARRYAEHMVDIKDDVRWARRVAAANRGRSLLAESTKYANKAAGYYGDYAGAMSGLASSAMYGNQWLSQREKTEYNPWDRARVNNRVQSLTNPSYDPVSATPYSVAPQPAFGASVPTYDNVTLDSSGVTGVQQPVG